MIDWLAKIASKKAFIWDFDGCFADTERLHFLAYRKAFQEFGHTVDESLYYESFSHLGLGAKKEIERFQLTCTVEQILERKHRYYWDEISGGRAKVFFEMGDVVTLLKQRGLVGIASNSPKHELIEILNHSSQIAPLDLVLGWTEGLRKKPAPDLFLKALELLKIDASDAVVFEDSDRGLAAAHAAGCEAIWIKTSYNEHFSTSWPMIARIPHDELLRALRSLKQ